MSSKPPILVSGAGPTGMVLALWLHKLSTPFRIIDKLSGPGQTSRAMVVHARTLEFYRQLGIADRIVSAGIRAERMVIAAGGKVKTTLPVAAGAEGMSKFPMVLSIPQDLHERILADVLHERGVQIERGVELVDAIQDEEKGVVKTKLTHLAEDGRGETLTASYVVGCDGAHSFVRRAAAIKMNGGTYSQRFFVSDVDVDPDTLPAGPNDLNMNLSKNEYCMVLPTLRQGNTRMIGFVPKEKVDQPEVSFEDVLPSVKRCVPQVKVRGVKWFSAYKVHHRAAERFRNGRLFLCGDACHLHSPVGGQGMNTGIGDATNLAWKLGAVLSGKAAEAILDTYESERLGFAHSLVKTTDRGFTALTDEGWMGWFAREFFVPYIMPVMMKIAGTSTWGTTSQINLEYKSSPLSENGSGYNGTLVAGNRLAFVKTGDGHDNFEELAETRWQIHVYGEIERDLRRDLQAKGFEVKKFMYTEDAEKKGLIEGAIYLVRPDGYIAAAVSREDKESLFRYMTKWELKGSHV